MRVLMVNPEFPETYWGFNHALKIVGKRSAYPPLGLLTVSALLPPPWEKRLIDLNASNELRVSDIEWADMVFVTGMLIQKHAIRRVVTECKTHGKRVVVGGPYVSTSMEEVPEADHIFVGEAETTLPKFVSDLMAGRPQRFYQAGERPPLTISPIPDFGLINFGHYNTMPVQYSRGCPFDCEFCDIIEIYGRVPRTKGNEQLLAELDTLLSLGWRGSVFIVDDNFIGNKKNVRSLVPRLAEWQKMNRYPFTFLTEASVNLADDRPLLADMRSAGFHTVFLGIETPVEASLLETRKTQNTKRSLLESVQTIQGFGIEVMAGFIVGFDNDPPDIFERQISFIGESAIPLAMVGTLTALPGTPLWKRLQREGRLRGESNGNNVGNGELNFVPVMDRERLMEGYRSIMRTIYRSSEYYNRVLKCLKRLPPPARPEPKFRSLGDNLAVFGRIVLRIGVIDRERAEFWRFAYRVLREHPDRFTRAMSHAVKGYHFRQQLDIQEEV